MPPAGVGGRVAAGGGAPDGGLVDVDDLVDALVAFDAVVRGPGGSGAVDFDHEAWEEGFLDEGGFAAARHPGEWRRLWNGGWRNSRWLY